MVFTLPELISSVFGQLYSEKDLIKIEDFIKTHDIGVTSNAFNEVLETCKTKQNWINKNLNPIIGWLKVQSEADAKTS